MPLDWTRSVGEGVPTLRVGTKGIFVLFPFPFREGVGSPVLLTMLTTHIKTGR